jgi:hypothetical protein
MLIWGIILVVVGAVVAGYGWPRDNAVRLIGIVVAVIGLVLILLAVLPGDAHAAAAAMFVPFWWRRRGAERQIDPEFARVLAAQVALGMAPTVRGQWRSGDAEAMMPLRQYDDGTQARSSLATIGVMLLQASKDDPVVQQTLRTDVQVEQDDLGATRLWIVH